MITYISVLCTLALVERRGTRCFFSEMIGTAKIRLNQIRRSIIEKQETKPIRTIIRRRVVGQLVAVNRINRLWTVYPVKRGYVTVNSFDQNILVLRLFRWETFCFCQNTFLICNLGLRFQNCPVIGHLPRKARYAFDERSFVIYLLYWKVWW